MKTKGLREFCKYCKRGVDLIKGVCFYCSQVDFEYVNPDLDYVPSRRRQLWPVYIPEDKRNEREWKFYNMVDSDNKDEAEEVLKKSDIPVIALKLFRSRRPLIGRLRGDGDDKRIESRYALYILTIDNVFKRGVPVEI